MKCSQCGQEQSEGMFCGLCGGRLIPATDSQATLDDEQQAIPDEQVSNTQRTQAVTEFEQPISGSEHQVVRTMQPEQHMSESEQDAAHSEAEISQSTHQGEQIEYQATNVEQANPQSSEQGIQAEQQMTDFEQAVTPSTHQESRAEQQVEGAQQSSESYDVVVETSKQYGSFFKDFMKMPSRALTAGSHQFVNAIINLTILSVIFALAFYRSQKVFYEYSSFDVITGSFGLYAFLTIAASMITVVFVIFAINKFFGNEQVTFGGILSVYGSFMVPAIFVSVGALFFALIKNTTYADHLLAILFLLVIFFIPLYITGFFAIKYRKNLDPIYAYFLYIIVSVLALMLVNNVILESITEEFLDILYGKINLLIAALMGY